MSSYETCSICGSPFEPVTICSECDDDITNRQIERAVNAERERIIQLLLRVKAMTFTSGVTIETGFVETALRDLLTPPKE